MARDFIIYNSDIKTKLVTTDTIISYNVYSPLFNDYMIINSDYSPLLTSSVYLKENVYCPLSFQIAGPISLRNRIESYILKIIKED